VTDKGAAETEVVEGKTERKKDKKAATVGGAEAAARAAEEDAGWTEGDWDDGEVCVFVRA